MAKIVTVQDIRLGALYRLALERRFDRQTVKALMVSRIGLPEKTAEQLSGHWEGSFAAYWKRAA